MATPTLANSPSTHDFQPYSGFLISDLVGTVEPIQCLPEVPYTLKLDDRGGWYWLWRLDVEGFSSRFYATRNAAEKLVARYQKVLAAREARSHEETT
jgi:hypothetical protein